jgi:hypothetical protein
MCRGKCEQETVAMEFVYRTGAEPHASPASAECPSERGLRAAVALSGQPPVLSTIILLFDVHLICIVHCLAYHVA